MHYKPIEDLLNFKNNISYLSFIEKCVEIFKSEAKTSDKNGKIRLNLRSILTQVFERTLSFSLSLRPLMKQK